MPRYPYQMDPGCGHLQAAVRLPVHRHQALQWVRGTFVLGCMSEQGTQFRFMLNDVVPLEMEYSRGVVQSDACTSWTTMRMPRGQWFSRHRSLGSRVCFRVGV